MHVDYIQQTIPDLAKADATIDSIVQKLVRFTWFFFRFDFCFAEINLLLKIVIFGILSLDRRQTWQEEMIKKSHKFHGYQY